MTFQKGNPGRPKGSKNKKLELLRSNDEKLQEKVLDMAMNGDATALRIIADRLWPRLRPEASPVKIDAKSDDVAEQARKSIDAALGGEITVDVLKDLLTAMYAHGRLIELTELEERLRLLEQRGELPPWEAEPPTKLPIRGKKQRSKADETKF